ncbi:GNAT family N-acetyltransferase [Salipiger sp.]|uniref:GNAT family N-acetyltransferase n=1 Tax=Salipiger sp. TaxID=2078585 RepID=UPI003A9837F1
MTPLLRPARSTDAGKLGAMISEAVAERPWKPRLHSGAEDIAHVGRMIERGWVTVAEDGDSPAPVGFIARERDYIHALFITPRAQRAGVGRALIEAAQEQCDRLELWTFAANKGALRFYDRAGFDIIGRGDGSGNEEGLPEVRFCWTAPVSDPPAPSSGKTAT